MVTKVKLKNGSGLPSVRFIGVHFEGQQFSCDVSDGDIQEVSDVENGAITLTAYRVSDKEALDTLTYKVSDSFGFTAILRPNTGGPPTKPYSLVGEAFEMPSP